MMRNILSKLNFGDVQNDGNGHRRMYWPVEKSTQWIIHCVIKSVASIKSWMWQQTFNTENRNELDTSAGCTDQEHQGNVRRKKIYGSCPAGKRKKNRWRDAVPRAVRKLLGAAGLEDSQKEKC
jgi:hypothetical protein